MKIYRCRTSIDDEKKAHEMANAIVSDHLASSAHIKQIESFYGWDGKVQNGIEYEVEFLCIHPEFLYHKMKALHTYEMPEFLIEEVNCSDGINRWCVKWCEEYRGKM